MPTPSEVRGLIEGAGGTVEEIGRGPGGSGFAVASFPLPKDHWLTTENREEPPMPFKVGVGQTWAPQTPLTRDELAAGLRAAARYAIRSSTDNGRIEDFDPDAMVQNFLVGALGYWTADGDSRL